jgi:hypothetical protein
MFGHSVLNVQRDDRLPRGDDERREARTTDDVKSKGEFVGIRKRMR